MKISLLFFTALIFTLPCYGQEALEGGDAERAKIDQSENQVVEKLGDVVEKVGEKVGSAFDPKNLPADCTSQDRAQIPPQDSDASIKADIDALEKLSE